MQPGATAEDVARAQARHSRADGGDAHQYRGEIEENLGSLSLDKNVTEVGDRDAADVDADAMGNYDANAAVQGSGSTMAV